jgi:hypothetical protein
MTHFIALFRCPFFKLAPLVVQRITVIALLIARHAGVENRPLRPVAVGVRHGLALLFEEIDRLHAQDIGDLL